MEFWITQAFNGLSYAALLFLLGGGLTPIFGVQEGLSILLVEQNLRFALLHTDYIHIPEPGSDCPFLPPRGTGSKS